MGKTWRETNPPETTETRQDRSVRTRSGSRYPHGKISIPCGRPKKFIDLLAKVREYMEQKKYLHFPLITTYRLIRGPYIKNGRVYVDYEFTTHHPRAWAKGED